MKLHAIIAGIEATVEIRRDGRRVFARVDDRKYELEVHTSQTGLLLRDSNGRVFDCRADGSATAGRPLDVFVGTKQYSITLVDPKRLRGAVSGGAHADGAAHVLAPMPGKVVRILVEAGAAVEAGAGIIVVEAMKMQNELKSPKAGIVTALSVEPGATVNAGDVLAIVE